MQWSKRIGGRNYPSFRNFPLLPDVRMECFFEESINVCASRKDGAISSANVLGTLTYKTVEDQIKLPEEKTMAFITWNDTLSVGIKSIDDQHKKLVALVNDLHDGMMGGKGNDVIGKVLAELIAYTKSHFAAEETLMKNKNYPEYAAHKVEHDKLTKKAVELEQQFKAGKAAMTIEVANFLKSWLTDHIMKTDKKYTPHLQ